MKFLRALRVAFLVFVVLQICLAVEPFGNRVMAAGGDLLWEQQLGIGSQTYPLQVLIDGQQLIVVGGAVVGVNPYVDGGFKFYTRLFVATYDLSTGAGGLVWSDEVGGTDGESFTVYLAGLVVSGQDVFVMRYLRNEGSTYPDITWLRKYDRLHGTLLWEQEVYGSGSAATWWSPRDKWVIPGSLTASGGRVFVSGTTGPFESPVEYLFGRGSMNPQAFTRAYNGANGHVIWSSRSPVSSVGGGSCASGNQVFVVLRQGNSQIEQAYDFTQDNSRQILRSYNAVTGAKLWERIIDPKKSVGPMKVNGSQLFVGGSTVTTIPSPDPRNEPPERRYDYVVQSDRIDTGTLLWENTLKNPGDDWVNDLVVAGQKVFIGGVQTNAAGSQDFMVKAYDVLTGRLFWKSLADAGGTDSVSGVVANSSLGMVFAVGIGGGDPDPLAWYPTGYGLVRAYNMNTGALAWQAVIDDGIESEYGPSHDVAEYASQAVVAGERLFVVGGTRFSDGEYDYGSLLIRAYAAK